MSTTMDQIHHIREMYYQQDKNISQIASIHMHGSDPLKIL